MGNKPIARSDSILSFLTVVGGGDGVIGVVRGLRAANDVTPPGSDLGASGDVDHPGYGTTGVASNG